MILSTTSTAAAVVLSTLGVPWADPNQPDVLQYTEAILANAGCKTVDEARAKNVPGMRMYFFGEHPLRDEIYKAFGEAHAARPGTTEDLPDVPEGALARFGAVLLKNRKLIMEQQKRTPALMVIKKADGSVAIFGKNARPEDLARLGLK